MWIIGLLLLAAAVVVGIDIAAMNDQQVDLEAFNQVWTSSPAIAFMVGVVTALVGVIGLWLMVRGMRRSRVRRRERRAEMAERDRLAEERRREIEAMSMAGRGDQTAEDRTVDDRTVAAADSGDHDQDREPVSKAEPESVDLREGQVAGHHEGGGLLHRSDR